MNLTQDDLQAIKSIVDDAVDGLVQSTAAGFAQVDLKFERVFKSLDELETDVTRVENKLNPTINQVDDHEVRLLALGSKPA